MLLSMDSLKSSVDRVGIHWIQRILMLSNCCLVVPSLRLGRHKPLTVLHKGTRASAPVQGFLFALHLPWNEVRISSHACATAEWSVISICDAFSLRISHALVCLVAVRSLCSD
ncbi:unnamed protein product [Effrenium voratum]|uniref:Uncharacterized protein n=1 Tax=Effrenium voratum TaxID=2562239 RepID=A0AA36I8L1_9DINO|nr:unnamed protein product [Effrenium voratum]CAJ1381679.1 unnamed protein product [Effrenium voratum]CAJ1448515.1 unnamed protein product [Effrenium voratum]